MNGTFLLQDGGLKDHSSERAPEIEKINAQRASSAGADILAALDTAHAAERAELRAQREKFALQ